MKSFSLTFSALQSLRLREKIMKKITVMCEWKVWKSPISLSRKISLKNDDNSYRQTILWKERQFNLSERLCSRCVSMDRSFKKSAFNSDVPVSILLPLKFSHILLYKKEKEQNHWPMELLNEPRRSFTRVGERLTKVQRHESGEARNFNP